VGGQPWFVTVYPNGGEAVPIPPGLMQLVPGPKVALPARAAYLSADSLAYGLAADPAGNIWIAQTQGVVARYSLATKLITNYPVPRYNAGPSLIARGPDGAIWFTESRAGKIGRMTTSGSVKEYTVPYKGSMPRNITPANDGNLWFTDPGTNRVGRITMSGSITEYALPAFSCKQKAYVPNDMTMSGGYLWWTDSAITRVDSLNPLQPPTAVARTTRSSHGTKTKKKPSWKKPKKKTTSKKSKKAVAKKKAAKKKHRRR
jgi:streptogramin lyase